MFFGGLFCSWVTVNPVGSDHSPFWHVWAVVQGHISALGPSCTHAAQEGAQGWVGSYVELGVPFPALSFLEFPHTCGLKEPLLCTLWLESQGGRQFPCSPARPGPLPDGVVTEGRQSNRHRLPSDGRGPPAPPGSGVGLPERWLLCGTAVCDRRGLPSSPLSCSQGLVLVPRPGRRGFPQRFGLHVGRGAVGLSSRQRQDRKRKQPGTPEVGCSGSASAPQAACSRVRFDPQAAAAGLPSTAEAWPGAQGGTHEVTWRRPRPVSPPRASAASAVLVPAPCRRHRTCDASEGPWESVEA